MTEDQAERLAEAEMNRLDKRFLAGWIDQTVYDREVEEIERRTKARISRAWR